MTDEQQNGLSFMLSTKKNTKVTKKVDDELVSLAKRDNRILIKDSNDCVQSVIESNGEDNYGDILALMESIKNDQNKD